MVDTPVLLIFFNRPEKLKQTFEQIRIAKPRKLYLAQDGPRENNQSDLIEIEKCRKIVEDIDWKCEVHVDYSKDNRGCGQGPFHAINWIFEKEDRAIILEDDCVASQSFFSFCDYMLNKYENDDRIFMITGCNMELKSDVESSYFFGYSGTNWGWATWKRNWEKMEFNCEWIKDQYVINNLSKILETRLKPKAKQEIDSFRNTYSMLKDNKNISYWDIQFQATRYLYNQISIIPKVNLITNIGIGDDSTHAKATKDVSKINTKVGKINAFNNQRFEMDFPLIHPKYMIQNYEYDRSVDKYLYGFSVKKIVVLYLYRIKKVLLIIKTLFIKKNK